MLLAGANIRSSGGARGASDEFAGDVSRIGWEQRVFSAAKIAHIVEALAAEGVSSTAALRRTGITPEQLRSPEILISVDQVIGCYRNALHEVLNRFH